MQLGMHWTKRSSPAVAATLITTCWTLALGIAAVAADIVGLPSVASRVFALARIVGGFTIIFGLAALVVSFGYGSKRPRRRPSRDRAVESVHRPASACDAKTVGSAYRRARVSTREVDVSG